MTQNNEPKAKPEDAAEPTKPEPDQEEIESLDSMALMDFLDGGKSSPTEPDEGDTDLFSTIQLTEEMQEAVASQIEPDPEDTAPSPLEPEPAEAEVSPPEAEVSEPEAEVSEPEAEVSEPEADHKEAALFDSSSLLDALEEARPSEPEPDPETTDPSPPEPDPAEAEVSPPEPAEAEVSEAEEADHDETAFFDASDLLAELEGAKPSEPEPDPEATDPSPPEPDPVEAEVSEVEEADHDETAFFDSSTLIQELKEAEADQIEPAPDETVFLDSGSPAAAMPAAAVPAEEPAVPTEITKIGNYEVVQMLGKGGFGSVWSAKASDGHPVAVKVLNPDVLDNERAVRKFFHEAINLAKMNHPNICRFIDFFPHEENYAIVMDFVQGIDLQDLLESQEGPLPFDVARRVASQALDGFHYALQKDVLHRDIKPENITLTAEGVAKIMDFGIARLSSSESQQTSLYMISPAYTAPERFDVNKTDLVDHRSDIYSLGLLFYEIFTGTHPFPTTNPTEMIVAHMSKIPTPPDEVVDLPQEISDAILKAIEKDPEDRFEDFAAFKMEMLGEPPLMASELIGPMEFFGDSCKNSAALLKTLSGLVKKHQKQAKKITVGQVGGKVNVIIETAGGNELLITRDIE